MFNDIYRGKRVLVSGNTGFKGSHLAWWLAKLGANVRGVSMPMDEPCAFSILTPAAETSFSDIRDAEKLLKIFEAFQPEIVFHLAAQSLVPEGINSPATTFHTNVSGTVNVLECCRAAGGVAACVVVTSDKCYRPSREPLTENSPLGGYDPYSASKSCAELVVDSYRRTFFNSSGSTLVASARAGNVIGGGDWAAARLIPDLIRSARGHAPAQLRNPSAIRPWQHVFEPLSGYLLLGAKLLAGESSAATAWNFAPSGADLTVLEVAERAASIWDKISFIVTPRRTFAENPVLRLSAEKAERELGWKPVWSTEEALRRTILWYKEFYERGRVNTPDDLRDYLAAAEESKAVWTI